MVDEIEVCEILEKKVNRFNTVTSVVVTDLITSAVFSELISVGAFESGADLSVCNELSGTSLKTPRKTRWDQVASSKQVR